MSTEPDDLDAFLAERSADPAFTQHWKTLQATDRPATTDQQPLVCGAEPAEPEPFEGHQPRECGEHRTTGSRAWCFDCSEWCYPRSPCVRCGLPAYRELLADIWLYVSWPYVTKQLTTEQKELWADAIETTGDPDERTTVDRWWREPAELAAARASEAPRGEGSPTPDVGAVRGGEGGSAAESEPRDTVKRRILETLDRWHEVGGDTTGEFAGVMEAVDDYAAAIRAAERELVAAQIEAVFVLARRDQSPAEAKADAYRTAAAIARGES